MKFTAVGDLLIQRGFAGEYPGLDAVRDYIAKGDFRFCNLETTVNRAAEVFASPFSGGSWLRIDPEKLNYLEQYGFNAVNCANNHSMDFSYNGVLATVENLRRYGYTAAGVGANLAEAAAPVYIDTPNGRVALIGVNDLDGQPDAIAGEQSRYFMGRPGVNGLRVSHKFIVKPEHLAALQEIAAATGVNVDNEIVRCEGYLPALPEGAAEFGNLLFREGEQAAIEYTLNEADMARIKRSIFEAKLQADYIFVSIHSHVTVERKDVPSPYLVQFAKECIDCGADGVIGHGPHLLRGIEIYKDKPIFYSLGDFILQNENIPIAPEEFFQKYGTNSDDTLHHVFAIRSNNFTRGLSTNRVMFETVIPYWEMEGGRLTKLELMPVLLDFDVPRSRYGLPKINKDAGILERLQMLSATFGTAIDIVDGVGFVQCNG